jgi:hypothetical protein
VPEVAFADGPDGPTRARRPAFAFASTPGSSFECRLDDVVVGCLAGSFAPAADLRDGPHLVVVRATNPAGTTGPWAPRGFSVDTTGPETVLVTAPSSQATSPDPVIGFHSNESGASFECSVDGSHFSPCSSPWVPGPLAPGPHRVAVRALDALGNPDRTPAASDFTVEAGTSPSGGRVGTGVQMLAERLVQNLGMTVGTIQETETATVLRQGSVRVRGIQPLVPGTLSVVGRARAARGRPIVLRGSVTMDAAGTRTLALRLTREGRAVVRRSDSVPLVVGARFSMRGLAMSAAQRATLVRDWLTPDEARRAVFAALHRSLGSTAKPLVEIGARCGSACLDVRAEWAARGGIWSARGRVRQLSGRIRASLAEAVRRSR